MIRLPDLPTLAEVAQTRGAQPKPTRFRRDVAKHAQQTVNAKVAREAKRRQVEAWRRIVEAIFARDKGRCRVCGRKVKGLEDDPAKRAHTHHVIYKSAGGTDDAWNLALLCGKCHAHEHEHRIAITGNADRLLTITSHDMETGKVRREWTSPNPSEVRR